MGKLSCGDNCNIVTSAESIDEPSQCRFRIPSEDSPLQPGTPKWANYVKGVVAHFDEEIKPFKAAVVSSIPIGGGLSSSASLEVATYFFLSALIEKTKINGPKVSHKRRNVSFSFKFVF